MTDAASDDDADDVRHESANDAVRDEAHCEDAYDEADGVGDRVRDAGDHVRHARVTDAQNGDHRVRGSDPSSCC